MCLPVISASLPLPNSDQPQPDILRDFGRKIRAARKNAGLTQTEVANRLGISQHYLSRIELGRGNPTLAQASRFAEAVDCSLSLVLWPRVPARSQDAEALDRIITAFEAALEGMTQSVTMLRDQRGRKKR